MTLRNINNHNIVSAVEMGCLTMSRVFNSDDDNIPYFGSEVLPNPKLFFSDRHSESHIPGRHLNALLTASNIFGVDIEESVIDNHQIAAFYSFSGSLPFPLNRDRIDGELVNFNEHNFREGFHALYALIRYRNSRKAMEILEDCIDKIFELWDSENGWDYDKIQKKFHLNIYPADHTFIEGLGRSIGPLVKIYDHTKFEPAIKLARILVDKSINEFFNENGTYDIKIFGTHTHSTTCVMSGIAQYGDLLKDHSLFNRVKKFYDNGLWEIRDYIGWVIENSGEDSEPDRGECNNTGDIIETALLLAKNGYSEYYEDAERIIRCHLLPSQLRDNSFIPENEDNLEGDGYKNIPYRHLGAFGFPAPYGHWPVDQILDSNLSLNSKKSGDRISFNMDIVGGVIGSLCEVTKHVLIEEDNLYKINLFFNLPVKNKNIEIKFNETGNGTQIKIINPKDIMLRIPSWAQKFPIDINGDVNYEIFDGYIKIYGLNTNQSIDIKFQLPNRKIVLNHRKRNIEVNLIGDNIISMENFDAKLTFFPKI